MRARKKEVGRRQLESHKRSRRKSKRRSIEKRGRKRQETQSSETTRSDQLEANPSKITSTSRENERALLLLKSS